MSDQLTKAINLLKETLPTLTDDLKEKVDVFLLPYSLTSIELREMVHWDDCDKIGDLLLKLFNSDLPDKSDATVTRRDIQLFTGTHRRRKVALNAARNNPTRLLETVNENLIKLDVEYPQFDVLLNDITPSLLKHYVTYIYHSRGLMTGYDPFKDPDSKRKLQINSEIFRLRSLYESLYGREEMVAFFKPIHNNPLG